VRRGKIGMAAEREQILQGGEQNSKTFILYKEKYVVSTSRLGKCDLGTNQTKVK